MKNWKNRQREVMRQIAQAAWRQPLQGSGFWMHDDIRNNFYYASYLMAAANDPDMIEELALNQDEAQAKACEVLTRILLLQDQDPTSETFGHWPLGLGSLPQEAKPNLLPAELMGNLMAYFQQRFSSVLPEELNHSFDKAIEMMYRSPYYQVPLTTFGHHEAKYTASKLIFGHRFKDDKLIETGRLHLEQTLNRVKELGIPEYGALPWFWHWIQAYTCAYACVPVDDIQRNLEALLDELWNYRAMHYLQGAWVGGRMRSLSHDLPRDGNVAFDYVQFGDFSLPAVLPRVEYAGLLFYQAPESAMQAALNRQVPMEIRRIITPAGGQNKPSLHSYLFVDKGFAAGGIWERALEFDNEQHRWGIDFPLRKDGGVNRLYLLPPGEGYTEGDPRHAGETGEVLFHRNTVMALYPFSEEADAKLAGVLPKGEWVHRQNALYGLVDNVYIALYMNSDFTVQEEQDRISISSQGNPGGVVVEAISAEAAENKLLRSLEQFTAVMKLKKPLWTVNSGGPIRVDYDNLNGDRLSLELSGSQNPIRKVNDLLVDLR